MIRLGHIEYSNCFPVHALLLEAAQPGIEIVSGIPSALNRALAAREIDVAPSSSIEYARSSGRYRLLREFVIGSDGAVGSILFETTEAIADLDDRVVAVPTASATSVVLLKILLQQRHGIMPRYQWFQQEQDASGLRLDVAAVDLHDARTGPEEGASDGDAAAIASSDLSSSS